MLDASEHSELGTNLIWLLGATYFLNMLQRVLPAVMTLDILNDFPITPGQLGLLGSAYFVTHAVLQIPIGGLVERFGAERVLVASLWFAVAGTALVAAAHSYAQLLFGRTLMAVGWAGGLVPIMQLLVNLYGQKRFGALVGVILAAGNLGSLMGTAPAGMFVELWGWRAINGALLVLTVLVGTTAYFRLVKGGHRTKEIFAVSEAGGSGVSHWTSLLLQHSDFLLVWLGFMLMVGGAVSLRSLWGGLFLHDVHAMQASRAGVVLLMIAVGVITTGPLAGHVADAGHKIRLQMVFAGGVLLSLVWTLLLMIKPPVPPLVLMALFFCIGVSFALIITVFGEVNVMVEPAKRPLALGIMNVAPFLGGAALQQAMGSLLGLASLRLHWAPLLAYRLSFASGLIAALGGTLAIGAIVFRGGGGTRVRNGSAIGIPVNGSPKLTKEGEV